MRIVESKFHFFEEMCIEKFGDDKGKRIISISDEILIELLAIVEDKGNKAIRQHYEKNMIPTIAYYKALLKVGYPSKEAYDFVLFMTQRAASEEADRNKNLGNMKFGFTLFRLFFKKVMNKKFPDVGWKKEWITYTNKDIIVNMKSCIYFETTKLLRCQELCTVFCENDITAFSGYQPAIIFHRKGTISEGKDVCDFHFANKVNTNEKEYK